MSLPIIIHFVKNWVLLSEPLAPFYYFSEQGSSGSLWTRKTWFSAELSHNIVRRVILSYPLTIIYGNYPKQAGTMSLMMLTFLPLVMFMPKPAKIIKKTSVHLVLLGLFGIVLWLILRPGVFALRFNLYAFLLLIPLPAIWAEFITKNEARPAWLTRTIAVSSIAVLCLASYTSQYDGPYSLMGYLTGRTSEHLISGPAHSAAIKLNKEAEPGDRVLSFNFYTFWYREDLLQCMVTSQEWRRIISSPTPQQEWELIYEQGVKYIMYNQYTHTVLMNQIDLKHIPDWLLVEKIYNELGYEIYRLTSKDSQHKHLLGTREIRPSVWQVYNTKDR